MKLLVSLTKLSAAFVSLVMWLLRYPRESVGPPDDGDTPDQATHKRHCRLCAVRDTPCRRCRRRRKSRARRRLRRAIARRLQAQKIAALSPPAMGCLGCADDKVNGAPLEARAESDGPHVG